MDADDYQSVYDTETRDPSYGPDWPLHNEWVTRRERFAQTGDDAWFRNMLNVVSDKVPFDAPTPQPPARRKQRSPLVISLCALSFLGFLAIVIALAL